MDKPTQCFQLELQPYLTGLYGALSRIGEWPSLVWDFFPIFLERLLRGMSAIEKRAFVLRLTGAALALNVVYWIASYGFYFGHLPDRISYFLGEQIIGPFRSVFTFAPIAWAVTIGAQSSGVTMTTPLVAIRSLEQYIIALIVISGVLAVVTDLSLWRRVRVYIKSLLGRSTRGRQLTLDHFMSRFV